MNPEENVNSGEPQPEAAGEPQPPPGPAPPASADPAPHGKGEIGRRDILKALAGIPVVGVLFYGAFRKKWGDDLRRSRIVDELGLDGAPAVIPEAASRPPADRIRLGIIGYGGRGEYLIRAAGFAHPDWVERQTEAARRNPRNTVLEDWLHQEDLNLELTAVCDLFDVRAERALAASRNDERPGGGSGLRGATRYRRYTELLASGDVDAVIVATPDHWHARISIDAARSGIHVYCEKAMTRTEEEAHAVRKAVREAGIKFQLGHQNRQLESHEKARQISKKEILGPITLVETTTNRNDPGGAWVYQIHPDGSPDTIDWQQFEEPAPHKVPFSLERFFRWRCWYDYGTGLSGDLFSHEYDAINQILEVGIPATAVSSGGIYFFKDGRDVPDVWQAVCEYPDRDLTLVYSATLASARSRGKILMGHDATMEVGSTLTVTADGWSTRYKELIEEGVIDTKLPLITFRPGRGRVDAVTSPTEEYFASRGLLYTYRAGRRVDVAHLHIKNWLDTIRYGGEPDCNVEVGFEEAITCHMATRSYLEGRQVRWDPVKERII